MSAPARAWDDLVATATLGTERRPVPDDVPASLGAATAALVSSGAERLLETAALAVTQRRAGLVPQVPPVPRTGAAPAGVRPVVPARAAARLRELLAAGDHDLVATWLRAAAAAGLRVPEHLLPAVLDHATSGPGRGALVAPVLDLPGAWLAAFRPRWAAVALVTDDDLVTAPDDGTWTHGTPSERARWLRHRHRTDPDLARAALTATWTREPADVRTDLLAVLGEGLGPDDEPLLVQALTDRSRLVRELAAGLLARLPGSTYVDAWRERLTASGTRAALLDGTHLPAPTRPPGAPALAVSSAARARGAGVLPGALEEVPAHAWDVVAGPAEELVALAGTATDREQLLRAWAWSSARDGRTDLVRALLADGPVTPELVGAVPADERVGWVTRAADDDPRSAVLLAPACPAPWPAALSGSVLRAAASLGADLSGLGARAERRALLGARADVADTTLPGSLQTLAASGHPVVVRAATRALHRLSVRTELHAELHADDPSTTHEGDA